jgi:hypothetical protein
MKKYYKLTKGKKYAKMIPVSKMIIGHESKRDVYESEPYGVIWEYTGTTKKHWNNPKYWNKVKNIL